MGAEIRLVVYDDKGEPIQSHTLWRIGHPQAAKDLAAGLAHRLTRKLAPRPRPQNG